MPHKKSREGWLSVTEVLSLSIPKPFLQYWYGKNGTNRCEQIKRESQELGNAVHKAIEDRFNGITPELEPNVKRMVDNFWKEFVERYGVKPISLELSMEDKKLKLQGTLDAICEIDGKIYICDWKTSNSLDLVTVPLQLSMYDFLNNGSGLGVAVRIDKEKDKVQIKWWDDVKSFSLIWKACLKVARYTKFGMEK